MNPSIVGTTADKAARALTTSAPALALEIEYAHERFAALPTRASLELLDRPATTDVPGAPHCCNQLLSWRGQWLALLDLGVLLSAHRPRRLPRLRYAQVVSWQAHASEPTRFAALALAAPPRIVEVTDAMQCMLPVDSELWPLVALSCFEHEGRETPILDTSALFKRFQD